jgi:1-deoxy-D-xylulose-5-phosphate reductoisomerase
MKNIILLGGTGSIGTQTLDIIRTFPDAFRLVGLSAKGTRPDLLLCILNEFKPLCVVVQDSNLANFIKGSNHSFTGHVYCGSDALNSLASGQLCPVDLVVSAQSGTSGVMPTIAAIEAGVDVALANKETLVTGGEWVTSLCRLKGSRLLPVDSEHSAILQCLKSIHQEDVQRLILTCSGGPFSSRPEIDLETISPKEALAHPTWNMGRKITIDSATLMNKGLEVIEAHWLFDMPQENIDIVIHPQSLIHSMVETKDGSIMAQLSQPDMRHPILYALTDGRHWETPLPRVNFETLGTISFSAPDLIRFPCLGLAREALRQAGTMPAVLNMANELAVDAFCEGRIRFTDIPCLIESVMEAHNTQPMSGLDAITQAEVWTRERVTSEWLT